MNAMTQHWILQVDDPAPTPPVPAGVEYHRVYARARCGILRGIAALTLLVIGLVGFAMLLDTMSVIVDRELFGRSGPSTPLKQAAGALSMALLIPYCMLLQRVLYGLPPKSLHSVAGRFRYGVFGRALLGFGPLVLIAVAFVSLDESGSVPWATADLWRSSSSAWCSPPSLQPGKSMACAA